jgi:hypothetical protein
MELFYILVISFAIVFLIIILTLIGLLMKNQDKGTVFPPVANDCPDFWTIGSDNKSCVIPMTGKKNTGTLYDTAGVMKITTSSTSSAFPTYTPATNGNVNAAPSTINFSDELWSQQGLSTTCAKKKWAVNWGISWDGITNYNNC